MRITEVRIKLVPHATDRLLAFGAITLDGEFVIRDLKLIMGPTGPFVAMPSRKVTTHCPQCGQKIVLGANYCSRCGGRQPAAGVVTSPDGRRRLYADIAHPITSASRMLVERTVVAEYERELERSRQPGYAPRHDDLGDEEHRGVPAAAEPPPDHPGVCAAS